jgi:hypothetical protein
MLTHSLFKTQSILMSAKSRKGQLDADLHTVQNPEHTLVSNKQEGPGSSQIMTYSLFKTQSMLMSEKSTKGQPDADLQPVQNPKHALVSNKEEEPARC